MMSFVFLSTPQKSLIIDMDNLNELNLKNKLKDIYTRHQQQKTRHKYARGTRSEGFGIAVFNISTKMTNEGSVVVICVLKNIH